MEGTPLGPGGEDITWPDQVAPRGRKASSTRKIKPQTSNHLRVIFPPGGEIAKGDHEGFFALNRAFGGWPGLLACPRRPRGLASGIYWDLSPMCL